MFLLLLRVMGLAIAVSLLGACGGGGGGSDSSGTVGTQPTEPTVPTEPVMPVEPTNPGVAISAATGGSVTSADGRITVTFPAGAFTADTTVTLTAVDAPALPAGFESVKPVAGSFTKLDFAGGELAAGATFSVGLAPGTSNVSSKLLLRTLDTGSGSGGSGIGVVKCSDQTASATFIGTNSEGYGSSPGFTCGPGANKGCIVGFGEPVDMVTNAPLGLKATDTAGDETLATIVNGVNGRTAAYYTDQPPGGTASPHLVIAGGGATVEEFNATDYSVIAVDGTGLALRVGDGCTVISAGTFISSTGAAVLQAQATSPPLLQSGESCPYARASDGARNSVSAVWAGNGWLVHTIFSLQPALYWVSPTGQITRQMAYTYRGPTAESVPDAVNDMAADAAGNAWLAVSHIDANSAACGGYPDIYTHSCVSLIHVTPGATTAVQRELGNLRDSDRRGDVSIAADSAGAVYLSGKFQATSNYSRMSVTKYGSDGTVLWSTTISDTWFLKPGGVVVDGNGLVYAYGDGYTEDGNGVDTFGAFVYRLDGATGTVQVGTHYGDYSNALTTDQTRLLRSARLFSVDSNGNLGVLGVYRGLLDGVGSGAKYGAPMDTDPNAGMAVYVRRFAIGN